MSVFNVLELIGGLCLFLFGMNVMGQALEKRAGSSLRNLLGKLTQNKAAGFFTGMGVTAVIQSSSAVTVMVVGFVNSGIMTLRQAINVIMGANVGTTVTAWILSLGGIESDNPIVMLLKPSSFTPILALIGIILYMFCKNGKKNDTGMILLGFATLMFGMDTMSGSVSGLKDIPEFAQLFVMFKNPILGVLTGALLTAVIQSSSASVGILQALTVTGQVSYGAAIPIIMGQNIGTCVTALLSSVGANKNAKRAALVHLSFNVIGTTVWLTVFCIVKAVLAPEMLNYPASLFGIAIAHSSFNILCTIILLPMTGLLEKISVCLVPDSKTKEKAAELDERLLGTPPIALERSKDMVAEMGRTSITALKSSLDILFDYNEAAADEIRQLENLTDHYEDIIGQYLVKLSSRSMSESGALEEIKLFKMIGDFERIADHSVNIIESAEELHKKKIVFSENARRELDVLISAVKDILNCTQEAFETDSAQKASAAEPLEQVIDDLKEKLRTRHILRLQNGECSIEAGFVLSDLLTNLERVSDHCSNIAVCIIEAAHNEFALHEGLRDIRGESADYFEEYKSNLNKYKI